MKHLKLLVAICILATSITLSAQDMNEGFTYLETGQYAKAETFFSTLLKDYPNNKTARLCYGRAIGLNGKPTAANQLFTVLLKDYPLDFEVKLNYAESLLWSNKFTDAKSFYENLVSENPRSFAALLGFANTLSNLKLYEGALVYVNKALEVSPNNSNALTSKKYIYLGYAYQKQQAQQYESAETLLTKSLQLFNDDKDSLLNLANLYLIWEKFDNAKATFERLAKQSQHNIIALNGLALVAHLKHKEKRALTLSTEAYTSLTTNTDTNLIQQTTERYIQALIWNKNYKTAQQLIDQLLNNYPNKNWVLALRATLNIYKSDFKKSLADYNQILANDSTSFDGNLGKANVLKALGKYDDAYNAANNTLKFYNNQKDATNFITALDIKFSPQLESNASHTFDNGNNKAYNFNTKANFPISTKLSILGHYSYRTTNNTANNNSANSNNLSLGISYNLLPNITLNASTGLTSAKAESKDYAQLLAELFLDIKAFKLQNLTVGYKRQVESFNADLLDRELVQNNFYANYNLSTNINLGWYTQLIYTTQNDGNTRNLLFTSLYYNLIAKPNIKVGANYQLISFKDQVPSIYFSPERFNAYELFINLIKDENATKTKQWFYNLTGAIGHQFIENDPKQSAWRLQGALGYKFSKRSLVNLYGTHSNIASATAAGFTFTEIGVRFKWLFTKKELSITN